MAGARQRAGARLIHTGLLGGSFNPAHRAHRGITLAAMRALGLDEAWWLVSPGNPLKEGVHDMAPLAARLGSARAMARHAPIRATAIEARLGTRYTIDTLRALKRRYPKRRFIWLMGADNLAGFPTAGATGAGSPRRCRLRSSPVRGMRAKLSRVRR